ncbi:MAG: hypothetical protein IJV80_06760 [Clostridia bacterium]|nr:hypothetical protein [Clostridia bacterium]
MLYCSIAFHELGHLIACLFKKRKVAALYLYPIKIEQNRIKLTKTFKFCVLFYKGEKEGLIHLFGPIFTLIQLLCAIILSICIPNTHTTVFLAASIVMLFGCGKDLFRTFHKHSQKD